MDIIERRKKVYENLPKLNQTSLSDIVLIYDINNEDYDILVSATKKFLCKSLSFFYKKDFLWQDSFLEDNDELIINLPNKTPNGILHPKKETISEFIEVQKSVNSILENLQIYKHIKKLAITNIRYKSSLNEHKIQDRPYYTSKLHSDAWVGHKGDAIFLIGALGDINNNTVEFNEPIGVHSNYLHKAESFDEGNSRYETYNFLGTLTKQRLGIMDHACLHRTLMSALCKPRISLDIAVLVDSEYSHANDIGFDESACNYYDPILIRSISQSNFAVKESIFDETKTTTVSIS